MKCLLLLHPMDCSMSIFCCRLFSTDDIMLCLWLVFHIVFGIYISRHAISSLVGHEFDCVHVVSSLTTSWFTYCLPFWRYIQPMSIKLINILYDIPHTMCTINDRSQQKTCVFYGRINKQAPLFFFNLYDFI